MSLSRLAEQDSAREVVGSRRRGAGPAPCARKACSARRQDSQNAVFAAGGRPARVLACHAYTAPSPIVVDGAVEAYWIAMSKEETQRYEEMLREALNRLMDRYRVPPRNQRLVVGDPESALPKVAKQDRAAVVVMGAVSRSGLSRVFIGHTAERVVDKLDCDVLIVKPRSFKTSVPPRPRPAVPLPPI